MIATLCVFLDRKKRALWGDTGAKKEFKGLKVALINYLVCIHDIFGILEETVLLIGPYLHSLGKKRAHRAVKGG